MTFFFLVPSGKTPASRHPLFFCYTNFKDYSQLAIAVDGSNAAEIATRLADFDKTKHFLSVFVFKDSFANFESLKNEMIRSGFEYHLVPFPDDAKVYIGDQTEPVFVQ